MERTGAATCADLGREGAAGYPVTDDLNLVGAVPHRVVLPAQRSQEWVALEWALHHPGFPRIDYALVLRIMGEFVDGFGALVGIPPSAVIFGSARKKPGDPAYIAAEETARLLALAGFGIITGGGPGIMEAGNKGAQAGGGTSIGLPMVSLTDEEPNQFQDLSLVHRYFIVRKTIFVKYAEAMVIFPGGFGTMDELFEALMLVQMKKVHPFPIILYDSQFWAGLLTWIRDTLAESAQTIGQQDPALLRVSDDPHEIAQLVLDSYRSNAAQQREPSLYR